MLGAPQMRVRKPQLGVRAWQATGYQQRLVRGCGRSESGAGNVLLPRIAGRCKNLAQI
jgi:hypothetical protein